MSNDTMIFTPSSHIKGSRTCWDFFHQHIFFKQAPTTFQSNNSKPLQISQDLNMKTQIAALFILLSILMLTKSNPTDDDCKNLPQELCADDGCVWRSDECRTP
ncbi:unnamed protein product [Mortierella alpina]